jgi:hypothetical protein
MEKIKYEAPMVTDLSALGVRGGIDVDCTGGLIAQNPGGEFCGNGAAPGDGAANCNAGYFVDDPTNCYSGSSAAAGQCTIGSAAATSVCASGNAA